MSCRFQCKNCMDVLTVAEKFAGRSILCPLCEYRVTVPAAGEAGPVLEQDFQAALRKFKRACRIVESSLTLSLTHPGNSFMSFI